ncbi:MAG: hypothetical protein AB8G05_27115 [Oligoflexales bacterium]
MKMLLIYVLAFSVSVFPKMLLAEKTKPTFSIGSDFKATRLRLPEALEFGKRKIDRKANVYVARPFSFEETLVLDDRYVSANYLQVFVVHLTSFTPYDSEFSYDETKAKELRMTLLSSRSKDRGDKGKMYFFRQSIKGQIYYKWISVFGDSQQTDVIIALYPEEFNSTFVPTLLEGLAETAFISEDSL